MESIADLVRKLIEQDKDGTTKVSKYVEYNMREDIDRTEAYLNSKHISGDTDYLGRPKPFFNICIASRNIWFRATDLDVKDIQVRADGVKNAIKVLLATIYLQYWMKKMKFGKFLNKWGLTLATHGSAVCKFIEKNKDLNCSVIDWNNFLCDPIDFYSNIQVEKLNLSASQLKNNEYYNKKVVKELIESRESRETISGEKKDNKDEYIEVYEVHGELPLSYITDDESDDDKFVQQMHVISLKADSDFTLYRGLEKKNPYILTHLIEKDGQTYAGGAIKNLFEAQWMVNDSQKLIRDHLELASKEIFQTMEDAFAGSNVLTNIENGQILKYKTNPMTRLNNSPDITALQSFKVDWQNIAMQINGTNEAMMGETPKSGTAWRQTQAILQESHSLFEIMTENKGLYVQDMLTEYIIPYIKTKMNNADEITAKLEDYQITQIDEMFVPNEVLKSVNQRKKDIILNGGIYNPMDEPIDTLEAERQARGNLTGDTRTFKPSDIKETTWKEYFKDLEWDLDFIITGENKDIQGLLSTLSTAFQVVATNPMVLQDPNARMVFNKLLSISGAVSPLELKNNISTPNVSAMTTPPAPMPQMA